jgi:hypothetical protein
MARSGDWITAGDGPGAFGAALILAVQAHYEVGKGAVLQWIWEGMILSQLPLIDERQEP